MAKGWVSKWGPRGKGHRPSHIPAIEIHTYFHRQIEPWKLPPSKSHIIQENYFSVHLSKGKHTLLGFDELGEDAESMQRCLTQLGVQFETIENGIEITGVGIEGFERSPSVLHAGNSGTALRLLIGLTSRLDFVSMVDGDASLRNRNHSTLLNALSPLGVTFSYGIEQERLPILVHGPWIGSELTVDVSHSSQPYSSILLSTCGIETPSTIKTVGDAVSRRHSALTIELMKASGASRLRSLQKVTTLQPWTSNPPEVWDVPSDASMMAFPVLACLLNNQSIQIENPVQSMHSLGHEVLLNHINSFGIEEQNGTLTPVGEVAEVDIDLRDANDLLPPLAAILALSGGGRLRGATHAKHKESNRIDCTAHLLKCFGLTCTIEDDGFSIEGGQQITRAGKIC
jgi:3-phosphoshikimate 1-carboxyvinyltransferase